MKTFKDITKQYEPLTEEHDEVDANGNPYSRWFGRDNVTIDLFHDGCIDIYTKHGATLVTDFIKVEKDK